MENVHSFHVPVMGTGYSIDTPIKIARFGISSVIPMADDELIERMRKYYCEKYNKDYFPINKGEEDYRAKRITSYLDMVWDIVRKQIAAIKRMQFEKGTELTKYFEMLPETSPLKKLYLEMLKISDHNQKKQIQHKLRREVKMGSIDINIMVKVDRNNYDKNGEQMPIEYNDGHAALRGFAKSKVNGSVVLSAGLNQRLYKYLFEFKDFYADMLGDIKKKIILKISDYRSAFLQGKIFAKHGVWISEYRIESGINCGGHAFVENAKPLGLVLDEFQQKRNELSDTLGSIYLEALNKKGVATDIKQPIRITVQGGIGTAAEDKFLRDYFKVDGTGWASPFLLCPEVTNVDDDTLQKLSASKEGDIILSGVSPLNVPFYTLKNSGSELKKNEKNAMGKPGSSCPRGYLALYPGLAKKDLCLASTAYHKLFLKNMADKKLSEEEIENERKRLVNKSCLCFDLAQGALLKYGLAKKEENSPAVCPGPNLIYFSKIVSLEEMVSHIYGRINLLENVDRPNLFIRELELYIDYISCALRAGQAAGEKGFDALKENVAQAFEYYRDMFSKVVELKDEKIKALAQLKELEALFQNLLSLSFS
ncbi:MAG: hypothetical protein HQL25_06385 [Candidatus Omnitrophica bacterium]|nr:hypothetical protein [Candidatus Omnitrophota bacterium]